MRTLYLGTDPSRYSHEGQLVHYPVIRTVPLAAVDAAAASRCTHWLFTSPNAVRHWFALMPHPLKQPVFAIGSATAAALARHNTGSCMPREATQEGMAAFLATVDLTDAILGWPRSALAREVLEDAMRKRGVELVAIDLYTTVAQRLEPVPDLVEFDEIVFASPSCVDAFLAIYGKIPKEKKLSSLGPITEARLVEVLALRS